MSTSTISDLDARTVPQDLHEHCFYRPGVIATYCIFSLPVGLCLYGLNVARRESRVIGSALVGVSAFTFLEMLAANDLGVTVPRFTGLGIFIGIGLLNMEDRPYSLALSRGEVAARWWPPLLWVLGAMLAVAIFMAVFGPEGGVE